MNDDTIRTLDISDGVPEFIGDGGESELRMPRPPRASTPLSDVDKTARMRKP